MRAPIIIAGLFRSLVGGYFIGTLLSFVALFLLAIYGLEGVAWCLRELREWLNGPPIDIGE